ncbi:flagellar hook-length control protein FliK [Thiohalorhabdus methylotrophus]|uniref:Flagellar hook-length control protein FliK n=1 Tax=Thiohalorhabdus methylotrophus TaxID=3242694 RepID=A0ABV4TVW1_9GAMM
MAQPPSGSIPGSRPVETTPIRIGRSQPGAPQLQEGRLYPATVVRGGQSPVLRLAGQNVAAEPRHPTLEQGARLLVRPQIQAGRVVLHVMGHGDIQGQVANRFGSMLNRFPWPLPPGGAPASGAAAPQGGGTPATGGPGSLHPPGSAPVGPGLGRGLSGLTRLPTSALFLGSAGGTGARPGADPAGPPPDSSGSRLPRLLPGQAGATARFLGTPDPANLPRPPLLGHLQPASGASPSTPAAGGAPAAAPAPATSAAARAPTLTGALLGSASSGPPPQIGASAGEVRGWLERLLEPVSDEPDRADQRQSLWERLLTEKGRLLLDRWAFVPLPFREETSGAWVQIQERAAEEEGAEPEATALRIWLNADHLGAMEVLMPLQGRRTWRIRCERPEARERLEAERPRLERLCRKAGHAVTLRVEGPEPDLSEPPDSLREAATIQQAVSSRA